MKIPLRALCATLLFGATMNAPANAAPSTIRVWSNAAMAGVVARWQDDYRRQHPNVQIIATTTGSDVAMAGLYTGRADIALLGREPTASEIQAFQWIFQYAPTRVEIMSGSVGTPDKSPALVAFVHRENPLSRLTLAQLDGIFGYEHLRGSKPIATWGDLGLGGEWATHPIALYGPDATSGTGMFFRHVVLKDSRKMNWDRMHEFVDGAKVVEALAADRFGIAIAPLGVARPELKPLALAAENGGPFVAPTAQNVASRTYALARTVVAMIKRAPNQAPDPVVAEFLRYVLGEGQSVVARDGAYLPLPAQIAQQQRAAVAKTYAQELADEMIASNPELRAVTIASSTATLGTATRNGESGRHLELALSDTAGSSAGVLGLTFASGMRDDVVAHKAEEIRGTLSRRILNTANLSDPYPIDPGISTKTYAQRLVDQTMARHPELLSLAMHVTMPNGNENVILGSSFGRIGKKADEDDMKVIQTGTTLPGVYAGGKRFGAEVALRDTAGTTIGALSVAYAYKEGDDQAILIKRAEALRDELRAQIGSVEQLVKVEQ